MADYSITYFRGDSYPKVVEIQDRDSNDPVDLTGYTLTLSVDTLKDPPDASTGLFAVTGIVTSPSAGLVEFTPTSDQNDLAKGTYYYDIQMVSGTTIRTVVKDKYIITQDLTKV